MGTDANRNYGLHWGEEGASDNPCDEAFRGSAAWSEVENRNLRHFLTPRRNEVKFFNTLHSYGQVIWQQQGSISRSWGGNMEYVEE